MNKRRYDEHDARHMLPEDGPVKGAPFWGYNLWGFIWHCMIAAGVIWFIYWTGFPDWVRAVIEF